MADDDARNFESSETVRMHLESGQFADGFKKWCVDELERWRRENPEEALSVANSMSSVVPQVLGAVPPVTEVLEQLATSLKKSWEVNPEAVVAMRSFYEWSTVDACLDVYKKRWRPGGTSISFDDAVRLACWLMVFQLPYPTKKGKGRPENRLRYIRDHELLAVRARGGNLIPELIEASESDPVHWEALEDVIKSVRRAGQPRRQPPATAQARRRHPAS